MKPLATIGYEGARIDDVIERLAAEGVSLLIDVRAVPRSRKPGFSKRQLAAGLDAAGIGYVHLIALGTPKAGRDAVRAGKPDVMRRIFAEHMTGDAQQAALAEATELATRRPCCLLCFERDHRTCHRTIVGEMIAERTGIEIAHLTPPLPA
jgi:uncharacterized protein (DUF488 family)